MNGPCPPDPPSRTTFRSRIEYKEAFALYDNMLISSNYNRSLGSILISQIYDTTQIRGRFGSGSVSPLPTPVLLAAARVAKLYRHMTSRNQFGSRAKFIKPCSSQRQGAPALRASGPRRVATLQTAVNSLRIAAITATLPGLPAPRR